MRRVAAVGSCLFALATASCAAIFGFDRLTEGGAAADAATDSPAATLDDAGGGPCAVIGYPENTATTAGDDQELFGAIRTLDFGIHSRVVEGYNLDRTCTFNAAQSSCTISTGPANFDAYVKDKNDAGSDNAGFALINILAAVQGTSISQDSINEGVQDGRYGVVFHVKQWNGTNEDNAVLVEVYPANGFGDGGAKPTFGASDLWRLDARYRLANLDQAIPSQVSQVAYVVGGTLVARFDQLALQIRIGDDPRPFDILLREVVITGTLAPDGDAGDAGTFLADGLVAGRWPTTEFLKQVRQIYIRDGNGFQNVTICRDDPAGYYEAVKSQTCAGRDIRSDARDGQNLPCDALSLAARIEGYRLDSLGTFFDGGSYDDRCASGVVVDTGDCP